MTRAEKLLQKVSEWRPAGVGRHSLAVQNLDGWTAHVTADRNDQLACLVWELHVARAGGAPDGFALRGWAEGVAARAVGLLEPLKLLEVDDARGEALLRSTAPAQKGDRVAYYEVRLTAAGQAEVRRFAASRAASGRDQVAFALTHEVLAKLVGDIAG